ncbi:hypothetical protein SERLADRAFT_372111 [Serpula lacrymans var. lacrymans S7.9]|uniref:Uncharacterized protein n=1 Tax=Serpula lacrymans var. lacrymans (strain S7.9) TaxID=578457 RepID=F8P4D1_SERL9|nr:uncharacterized protein SERLADRAFT_372111 [Serpula lacrymans var. lacrymans S7.9]EGO21469.1 hypothetical protein SERLADRAFT_372111 [Serpula lacrymans var. lacrymans S7.9]
MAAPLLAAILESVDIASSSLSTIHRTCRLVNLLVTSKRDAHLDVLEVVAYHTAKTRRAALSLLHTFWPKALGHPVVSKPLPLFSYAQKLIEGGHVVSKCFSHNSCLDKATSPNLQRCRHADLDSSYITVDFSLVRRSFTDYYRDICMSPEELIKRTYEEVSVFYTVLWTQLQLFNHGVAHGTIIIENKGSDDHEAVAFELQYYVELYEPHLLPGKLPVSAILGEYFEENATAPSSYFLFDWSNLTYIASIIKSPYEQHQPSFDASHDLLNVVQAEGLQQDVPDNPRHPFEVVALGHMRDCLGYEFNLFSDTAARLCLSHLHSLGFFTRSDSKPILFHGPVKEDIQCESPLPLGFDLSTDVETLVSAIEACLSDIDLSVNEMGLLLLVRKFWPNGMASEYAWRRLSQTVLLWILQEDDNMATIVRDYISQHRPLPGIRSPAETPPWPAPNSQRRAPATSFNNGGDYVASRQALLGRYVGQWLLALHNQRIEDYAKIIFCAIKETAKGSTIGTALLPGEYSSLREKSLPSLQRLFNREAETTSRFSTIIDATLTSADTSSLYSIDPWRIVHKTALESREGFSRSLNWLRLFARSGVDITVPTFVEFASRARVHASSLADCSILVDAAFLSTWLRSMGRQELQSIFSPLHSYLSPPIMQQMKSGNAELAQVDLLRKSLATCLLLYGCERSFLRSLGLVTKDDISYLPSRRKTNTRASKASDPIIVDSAFINILGDYVATGIDEVAGLVAKFLYAFISHAPLVESYEVDNFILRNGSVLCSCIWQFYDIQSHELSSIRMALLLRVLVVDTHPFQAILNEHFQSGGNWRLRFLALMRIFRIILDVTSPAFHVEGRQWRSSTLEIYYHYFKAGWADEQEEIRVAIDTWSQTLLPAHFEAISYCWNEAIGIAPISERVRLVSFLIQLHPHFPSWKVISWDVIIETLLEDEYLQKNGDDEDGPAAAHLSMYGLSSEKGHQLSDTDPEISQLRVSIVLLSLKMLASGIEIDVFSLLKLKLHLVKIVGFEDVALVPATNGRTFHIQFGDLEDIPEDAYPCIDEFPAILDARHAFDLPPSAMASPFTSDDNPSPGLIGTVLVDVVLATFCSISDPFLLPVLSMKNLFESLMIIIYKHDFDSTALKHLDFMLRKAMRKTLEFLLLDLSYEMRQLALSIVQAYTKRFSFISGSLVIESVEKAVALVVSLDHNGEDMLVSQARAYIENTLNMLTSSGIFCGLCKRNLEPEFFTVLKHIVSVNAKANSQPSERLSERLLQSVLSQPLDANWSITQLVVDNVHSYVKLVHHEDYGDLLTYHSDIGGWLTTVARRMSYETLLSIMNTTSDLYRDHQSRSINAGNQAQANEVALAMLDVLEDILRLKARVSPSTLTAIAETILSTDVNTYTSVDQSFFAVLRNLASSGLYFLQNHVWSSTICDEELSASLAVAKIILRAADFSPTKFSRINTSMRTWNVLTLAALSDTSGQHGTILFPHFSAFTPAYYASLGTYVHARALPPESAVADIDHAYLSIKLWLLLAQTMSLSNDKVDPGALSVAQDDRADLAIKTVWNELWPPFESIVESCIQTENSLTTVDQPLATIVCSSVANLFLLVYQLRCGISLDALSQAPLLTRLQRQHRKISAINKVSFIPMPCLPSLMQLQLSRAMGGEPLPDIQLDVLLDQATKDLANAEKLRILDRESQRPPPDRQRRDVRIPT